MTEAKRRTEDERAWLMSRLWRSSQIAEDGCWEWLGSQDALGYGRIRPKGTEIPRLTHRVAWEALNGPVPNGLELDHLCRNPSCWRPDHLEPVTHAENMNRSPLFQAQMEARRAISHCPAGHPYDETNTILDKNGGRGCRECNRRRHREWLAKDAGKCEDCGKQLSTKSAVRCNVCHLQRARKNRASALLLLGRSASERLRPKCG